LDPFLICFPQYQKLYGKGEIDSPWPLLMRNIFHILYDKEEADLKRRRGKYHSKLQLPPEKNLLPKDWAAAFNKATFNLRSRAADPRIEMPEPLNIKAEESAWQPIITLTSVGKDKVKPYRVNSFEKKKTRFITRRVEKHMAAIRKDLPSNYRSDVPGLRYPEDGTA